MKTGIEEYFSITPCKLTLQINSLLNLPTKTRQIFNLLHSQLQRLTNLMVSWLFKYIYIV